MEHPFPQGTARPISQVYIQECSYIWKPVVTIPDFATVRDENLEQVIFGGRQLDLLPIELHNPRGEVHPEWTCAKLLLRRQWIQSIH